MRCCPEAIFCVIFASCIFSDPRAAGFRPASEIRTKATPCVEVWQTSNLRRLRLGEEIKKKKKKKPQHENIMVCSIPYGDHNKLLYQREKLNTNYESKFQLRLYIFAVNCVNCRCCMKSYNLWENIMIYSLYGHGKRRSE